MTKTVITCKMLSDFYCVKNEICYTTEMMELVHCPYDKRQPINTISSDKGTDKNEQQKKRQTVISEIIFT